MLFRSLPQKRSTGLLDVKTSSAEVVEEPAPNNVQGAPDPNVPKSLAELKALVEPKPEPTPEDAQAAIDKANKDIADAQSEIDNKMAEAQKLGTGLLGSFSDNLSSSGNFLEAAIKTGQEQRQKMLDAGYTWNPKTKSWNK